MAEQQYYIQGDFHYVAVTSPLVRPLLRAGFRRSQIESERDGFKRYGRQMYPRYIYHVYLYPHTEAACEAKVAELRARGLSAYVRYHCAD